MSQIDNWQVFQRDPRDTTIPNDGVSEVGNPQTEAEWGVLHYELKNFVCEGEYHRGLGRILSTYLTHTGRETQPAVWVSGFYGSGKSHLVRVLEYLWRDLTFPDGATARGLVTLPSDIEAQLKELSTLGRRGGGLWTASGTLGEGAGPSVRLAILGIIFQAAGLPTSYEQASFVLYLKQHKVYEVVKKAVEDSGNAFAEELRNLFVSPILASAVLEALPGVANSAQEFRALLREQYKKVSDVSEEDFLQTITAVLSLESGDSENLPYTVLVLDEVQQYLDHYPENTLHVQTVVQALSKRFGSRVLCVATGQSALMAHSELQKLKDRFTVHVELSDSDVEQVLRQVVLRKASTHTDDVKEVLTETSGEIDRHLQGTKVAASAADKAVLISDYPLLPSRRRFWEKALRAMDKAGSAGQLRTQLRMVHEATKLVADDPLGNVVAGDFVYDQQSAVMLQSGVILKEIEETIREMRDGTPEGNLKSRLCALIFTISQLPREPGTDSGVRSNATTLADLLVTDLTAGSDTLRQQVPERLKELVEAGILLKTSDEAGDEYKLQTKESAEWEQSFKSSYQKAFADDGRLATDRNQRLRESLQEQLKRVRLPQGKSKTPRNARPSLRCEQSRYW